MSSNDKRILLLIKDETNKENINKVEIINKYLFR